MGNTLKLCLKFFLIIEFVCLVACSERKGNKQESKDASLGPHPMEVIEESDDHIFEFARKTYYVKCQTNDVNLRLEFRGSILFLFDDNSDNILSIVDVSDQKENGFWNRIKSIFNGHRSEPVSKKRETDVLNWAGCDGLAPKFDKANVLSGTGFGRRIQYSMIRDFSSSTKNYDPADKDVSLKNLKGTRLRNELMRRVSLVIPILGFFLNKILAAEDGANQTSIGKAIKQVEFLVQDERDLFEFMNSSKDETVREVKMHFQNAISYSLFESATNTPLIDLFTRPTGQEMNDFFYKNVQGVCQKVATGSDDAEARIKKWMTRDLITLAGNLMANPGHMFVGLLMDGHVGNIDHVMMGYCMEEALIFEDELFYENARHTLSSQANIPSFPEVIENIRMAHVAVKQFACSSMAEFTNSLNPEQKKALKEARAMSNKVAREFNRWWGQLHDGILGNYHEAKEAYDKAKELEKSDDKKAKTEWKETQEDVSESLVGLGHAAQFIFGYWDKVENRVDNDAMARELFRLARYIQFWGKYNTLSNRLIDTMYTEKPELPEWGKGKHKDIVTMRKGEGNKWAESYKKLNEFLLYGEDDLMNQLNLLVQMNPEITLEMLRDTVEINKTHKGLYEEGGFIYIPVVPLPQKVEMKVEEPVQSPF